MISRVACCAVCTSSDIKTVAKLKPTPYGNLLFGTLGEAHAAKVHAVHLRLCERCGLLQLDDEIDREMLERNYFYDSSQNTSLRLAQKKLAEGLVRKLSLSRGRLVIGAYSGDGEGLIGFQSLGMEVAGFDPSNHPSKSTLHEKVTFRGERFDENLRDRLHSKFGLADIVTCWFRLANSPEPLRVLRLMRDLLEPTGSISILTGYHPDQFAIPMFEYINHDHLVYFDVYSMKNLAVAAGLKIVSVERLELRGGAIHFELARADSDRPEDSQVHALIQRENWLGVREHDYFKNFLTRIDGLAKSAREAVEGLGSSKVLGLGASISANQLLHQFSLGHFISRLFDDDIEKIGKFSPGFGLEVSAISDLGKLDSNSSIIVLSWQHEDILVRRAIEEGYRGKFVTVLPQTRAFFWEAAVM